MNKREIKFRGKAVMPIEELNEMGFVHENGFVTGNLTQNGNRPFIVGDVVKETDEYLAHESWIRVDPETVGQYTGLNDKNGTEIYEDDVLKVYELTENRFDDPKIKVREYTSPVFWKDLCWLVNESETIEVPLDILDISKNYIGRDSEIEVIGNIHEDDELLEVSE